MGDDQFAKSAKNIRGSGVGHAIHVNAEPIKGNYGSKFGSSVCYQVGMVDEKAVTIFVVDRYLVKSGKSGREHNRRIVSYYDKEWYCSCGNTICSHIRAVLKIWEGGPEAMRATILHPITIPVSELQRDSQRRRYDREREMRAAKKKEAREERANE